MRRVRGCSGPEMERGQSNEETEARRRSARPLRRADEHHHREARGWSAPLEEALGPRKCSAGESPMNPVTGRTYRGINALALAMSPRAFGGDPRWMSYRQGAARGWQVRKHEKGTIVFFYKKLDVGSDDEDRRTIPLLRAYVVFHASQLDGIPELGEPEAPKPVADRIV